MRRVPILLFMLSISTPSVAQWNCSNRDIAEIQCGNDGCEIKQDSFTPMELSIDPGRVEICAYSGCFPGRIRIRRTADGNVLFHASVRIGGENRPMSVILDTSTGTALMRWGGLANVMRCTRN